MSSSTKASRVATVCYPVSRSAPVPIPVVGVSYADAELKLVPTQKLRFAFWCAEEAGLLGSEHYVENLSDLGRNLDESLVTIGSAARFSSCDVVF